MCVPAFPTNARVQDFGANSIVQSTFRLHSWVWFCDNKKKRGCFYRFFDRLTAADVYMYECTVKLSSIFLDLYNI